MASLLDAVLPVVQARHLAWRSFSAGFDVGTSCGTVLGRALPPGGAVVKLWGRLAGSEWLPPGCKAEDETCC
jgi:hypothetical protein